MENKKKKVLYVITKSEPFGGAQKYVYDLATRLPQNSFTAVVALGGNGALMTELAKKSIRVISIRSLERDVGFLKELLTFSALLKLFQKEKPDIVHLNSSKAGGLGALAARIHGVKHIIFTAHGLPFEEDRSILARITIRFLSWITFLLCHRVIVISEKNQQRILTFLGIHEKKVTLIHNGITTMHFLERNQARVFLATRASLQNYKEDTLWIGTVAELHSNKGLEYAFDGFAKFRDAHPNSLFFIIGDGEEREKLTALTEKRGLSKNVFILGEIPHAAQYLKALDIFLLTSVKEGHPYVLLEAGAAALPVLATNVAGIPDIITDMQSGMLIQPKRSDEVARALTYLTEHPKKQSAFGSTLRKTITTHYTVETMLAKTLAAYEQ